MEGFLIGAILFSIGGLIAIFVNERIKPIALLCFSLLAQIFILPKSFVILLNGGINEIQLNLAEPIGNVFLRLDPLAALFVIIISFGALLVSIYSIGYMKMYRGESAALSSYYFFLGLMTSSMLLVVTVQNALFFLIVWELMSISSFFLVTFENSKEEVRKAGIYYLIAMQIGAAFLICAFCWVSSITGSFDFNSFDSVLSQSNGISIILFFLFFIGFGTKAGFIPMHTWLPRAHPAAPTGVSAIMSGVMIKTGIYGILRIILLSGKPNEAAAYIVFILGLITGIIGIVNAISQRDIKKLLAYSSIENIGIIGAGIGLGMLGTVYNIELVAFLGYFGALLHVANHFIFKSVLFYGAGIVYSQTHTRNIDQLGGLVKHLPATAVMFLIASLAISGMPLLNGFISEFSIYYGIIKSFSINNLSMNIASLLGISGIALIGVAALLGFTKLYGICFLGLPRSGFHLHKEKNLKLFLLPMIVLTWLIIFIGLLPSLALITLEKTLHQFLPVGSETNMDFVFNTFSNLTGTFIIFISLIFIFIVIRLLLLKRKSVQKFKTWDCGYQTESSRFQYTSSSFIQPFLQLVSELVPQKIKIRKEQNLFPKEAHLESHSHDLLERILIQPVIRMLNAFLEKFSWIQSGRMQQYIIYGLLFLVFLLIWIIGAAK